ncbi:MAG: acyltransferase family protein [Candidatus Thorarchaeota archaeon]|jgi:fucose 4-O-acetylase-like acetyltransferase
MTEKRESWITIAKAVALVLVVFIHSTPRDELSGYLTGFVMPAFFILYGVAHNSRKCQDNLGRYIVNRARALMIPYVVLNLVMMLMYAVVYPQIDYGYPPVDTIFWFFYGTGPIGRVNHLWFLRTMFFAIILYSLVDRYLHDKSIAVRLSLAAIAPGIGVMFKYASGVVLVPWGVDAVFIAFSFMMIGSEIRKVRHLSPWSIDRDTDLIGFILAFFAYSGITILNGFVNIGESIYGASIYTYMLSGILGTYMVCLLSFYAGKSSIRLTRVATSINAVGQEIYETHPLIGIICAQLLSGIAIFGSLTLYPGDPLVIIKFPLALLVSYFFATKVIRKFGVLQFMYLGFRKTQADQPRPTFPVPVPNGNDEVECLEEHVVELVMTTNSLPEEEVDS